MRRVENSSSSGTWGATTTKWNCLRITIVYSASIQLNPSSKQPGFHPSLKCRAKANQRRLLRKRETPAAPPASVQSPIYNISPEDSKELARLMKRMSGDYTYTKQIHWPDGSVSDDGYIVATMSLTLEPDFKLVQKYLKCNVSNPGWRTDGYVISTSTQQDCDKNLHDLKWKEETETAPLGQVNPSSIQIVELDKHGSDLNLSLFFGYEGYDPNKPFILDEEDEEDDDSEDEGTEFSRVINASPGFTIIRCRNRGTCGQMAADLKTIVGIAKKYVPPPAPKP